MYTGMYTYAIAHVYIGDRMRRGDKTWKNVRLETHVYDRLTEMKNATTGVFAQRYYANYSYSELVDKLMTFVSEHEAKPEADGDGD